MPAYTAYGLRINSNLPLPELVAFGRAGAEDIVIHSGTVDLSVAPAADKTCLWATAEEICLYYHGIVKLLIRGGREVVVDADPAADPATLRLILLGPVLGMILHQRGFLVLHASAVQIGQATVAFIGPKGAGKSTTAAAFHARGHRLVADDVVAVAPETFLVHPAFPQIKLWAEAARHVHGQTDDLPRLAPDLEKFALSAGQGFSPAPAPLRRVFALRDGDHEAVLSLPPQEAFMELVKNSYALAMLRPTHSQAAHFRQAVALAGHVPVRGLVRRRHLPALDGLIAAVVADAT